MQRGQDERPTWTEGLNQDALVGGPGDDDFTFLELGNDFTNFDTVEQHHAPSGLDTPMGRLTFAQGGQLHPLTPQQQAILHNVDLNISDMQPGMAFAKAQRQQQQPGQPQQFQQYAAYQEQQIPYQHQVPPTPVSAEMHGAKYPSVLDSAGQLIFERQNVSFTPLVSPAQTPVENPWGMPEYVVPHDFFSPLTSPALEGQPHYASTNTTSSPTDLNGEQPDATRKPRPKLNPRPKAASKGNLRSSPTGKGALRRRQPSMDGQPADRSTQNIESSRHLMPGVSYSNAVSSEDSVSPEPPPASLMRPPPIPLARTPASLRSQPQDTNVPATPAMLMKIRGKKADVVPSSDYGRGSPEIMEDIALPAAAADLRLRDLPEINTEVIRDPDDGNTPTLSAKTPKLSAGSTPRSAGGRSAKGSHENLVKPARGGRVSKKRQSMSQATVSPALRPKISPSITPLVPNTGPGMPILSAETSALYLASKSNYQNIIDGTHLPGVSYPETLAENLSSKRTSHKIAEQGRRNRINLALKEIESLLPASILVTARKDKTASKEEHGDDADKPAAAQGASKASTVEMAIVYIKSLQAELQETKDKLEAAERSLAEHNSCGSQTSGDTTHDEK